MNFIKHKPLSVNEAWKGERFKTPLYKKFIYDITILIRSLRPRPKKPDTDKSLFAHYIWGVSNNSADTDNPCKPFQDTLFNIVGYQNNGS